MSSVFDYNTREQLVKCFICGREEETKELAPKCPKCGMNMITVLVSALTGERVTK